MNDLEDRLKTTEFKEEILLNEGPIPVDKHIANRVLLRDYREKDDPTYSILTIQIEWDDGVVFESKYDTGRPKDGQTLKDVKNMIVGSEGQSLVGQGHVIIIASAPSLVELVGHCFYFRECGAGITKEK